VGKFLASIFTTAMSVSGSVPTTFALNIFLSLSMISTIVRGPMFRQFFGDGFHNFLRAKATCTRNGSLFSIRDGYIITNKARH